MMAMAGLCTDSERMVVCANWAYEWGCSQMRPSCINVSVSSRACERPRREAWARKARLGNSVGGGTGTANEADWNELLP